jgi:cysteine synthase
MKEVEQIIKTLYVWSSNRPDNWKAYYNLSFSEIKTLLKHIAALKAVAEAAGVSGEIDAIARQALEEGEEG